MSSSDTVSVTATEQQHRHRERALNAHHASRARHEADSVVLAEAEIMLLCDSSGNVPAAHGRRQGLGLFHRDTRFLSAYEMTLNGEPLVPLSSQEGGGAWSFHVLGNPQLEAGAGASIAPHTVSVRRERTVGEGVVDLSFLRSSDDNVGVSWTVRDGPLVVESAPPAGVP
jgi:N-terminal domain of (some) glycogen debranching enzymes